jgi:hypothetical protein
MNHVPSSQPDNITPVPLDLGDGAAPSDTLDARQEMDGAVRASMVRRPLVALAGALAGGLIIGRRLSR